MTRPNLRVLVTGADDHYGHAVIRGLSLGGVHVIAGSTSGRSAGFGSPNEDSSFSYGSPVRDRTGFMCSLFSAIDRTHPDLVMAADDASLSAVLSARMAIETRAPVAAAQPSAVARLCDLRSVLQNAQSLRVPAPRWTFAPTVSELIDAARAFRPPFVVKPRGHGGASDLPARLDFRVRYAAGFGELARILEPLSAYASRLVVIEHWRGISRAVAGVWQDGEPVARIAFERERELPGADGSSVVRRTIPLDRTLDAMSTRLMAGVGWTGAGLVEFNYDRRTGGYELLGVRSRLHDAAALCVTAGVNLPVLAAAVHLNVEIPAHEPYREGIVQRWLGGDVQTLWRTFATRAQRGGAAGTSRHRALWRFVRDFGRASRYDELCTEDWLPSRASAPPALRRDARELGALTLSAGNAD